MISLVANNISRNILSLAFVSGVCGISYELLYSRVFSSYFGDTFYVTTAILISFLISLAIGSVIAHRIVRFLPYVEILIGLYAFLVAFVFSQHMSALVIAVSAFSEGSAVFLMMAVLLLLMPPAVLIGFSVPMFSLYLQSYRPQRDQSTGYRHIYLFYNLGAAIAIVLLEFWLIRTYGITASLIYLGSLNLLIGVALYVVPAPKIHHHLNKKILPSWRWLLILGVVSGMYQLLFLKISHRIFGPLNENFAMLLVLVFFGIAFGTYLVNRTKIRLSGVVTALIVLIPVTFILTKVIIYIWAFSQGLFALDFNVSVYVKVILLSVWALPVLICLGAIIPLVLREEVVVPPHAPGLALAASAFGNAVGFLILVVLLHNGLSIPTLVALSTILVLWVRLMYPKPNGWVMSFSIALMLGLFVIWPSQVLDLGYVVLRDKDSLQWAEDNIVSVQEFRVLDEAYQVVTLKDKTEWLTSNGYVSMVFDPEKDMATVRESIVAIAPYLYSERTDKALTIGVASGVTAGVLGQLYKQTDAVELNPAVPGVLAFFAEENLNVLINPAVTIHIEDGFLFLLRSKERYDLISISVPSPTFYAASKLWTEESLMEIQKHLTDGGVYSAWFDLRLGTKGIHSMLETHKVVFKNCKYHVLANYYFNIVCSQDDLIISRLPTDEELGLASSQLKPLQLQQPVSEFIIDLSIPLWPENTFPTDGEINTMDRPVLEFVTSPYFYFTDQIYKTIRQLSQAGFNNFAADSDVRLSRKCENMILMTSSEFINSLLPECERKLMQ